MPSIVPKATKKKLSKKIPSQDLLDKEKDDAAIALISGLNMLMTYASATKLSRAEEALAWAKDEIVYWATEQNFYEADEMRLICR